jgi:hypothetical protein
MWLPVAAFLDSPCQGVSLQAIFRAGDAPKGTKNVLNSCILNFLLGKLPNYIVHLYPFLCKILFSLFRFVEDVPYNMAEFIGDGHWWMAVKRRGRRVGKKRH